MKQTSVLDRCLAALYLFAERWIPTGKHECFMSFPAVEDSPLAVYEELLRRGDHAPGTLVWLHNGDPRAVVARLREVLGDEWVDHYKAYDRLSLRGIWCFLRARRVYFTHNHYGFVRSGRKPNRLVNLWHGMPLKAIGQLDPGTLTRVPATDLTIAASEFFRPIMAGAMGVAPDKVLLTGLPRCDRLAGATRKARELRAALLGKADRLVVWMPTFRFNRVGPSRSDSVSDREAFRERFIRDMETLSGLGQANGCAIVVKLHPMDFLIDQTLPAVPGVTVLRPDAPELEACSLYDLLAVTDGLITDVSSVCFDFMSTRRPILITRDFVSSYTRGLLFDPEKLFAAVFTSVDWKGAAEFLSAVRTGQKLDSRALAEFCKFHDAGSASRVLACMQALDHDPALDVSYAQAQAGAKRLAGAGGAHAGYHRAAGR